MLYEFIEEQREDIITRTRNRLQGRPWPAVSSHELEHGVPLFLTQLSDTLRLEGTAQPFSRDAAMGSTAALRGAELLEAGFDVAQVVRDYGDICQTITELPSSRLRPLPLKSFIR